MPHVGHIRSAIAFDQLTRWLQYRGFRVTAVRNVTDIDDKILAKSAASFGADFEDEPGALRNEEWWALAYRYEQEFLKAYDTLGVSRPTYEPRATGHIPEMHTLIQQLIDRGHAYPALDDSGDVYFDVRSWSKYGSLTRQKTRRHAGRPGRGPPRQEGPPRLRAVEGLQGRGADDGELVLPVGRRPPGLAPRMLRDGHQIPRHRVRHPRRRPGPALPAPRKRNGAVPGGRPRLRQLLDAQRDGHLRRREDVQVHRQHRQPDGNARNRPAARCPVLPRAGAVPLGPGLPADVPAGSGRRRRTD